MDNSKPNLIESNFSRRDFISKAATVSAGFMILPSRVISGLGHIAPSDKLNIVGVGVGGRGLAVLREMEQTENIIGLCDVDWRYAQKAFDHFPGVKKFWDWRIMYE